MVDGDSQLAWGMLLPEKIVPLTCWSIYTNGRELCLIEGDMYDDVPGLRIHKGNNPELARRVAAHMREHPEQRLKNLIGIYSGVYVDPSRSCTYLFGDLTGNRPVFWLSDAKRLVVTGNLWAFRGCTSFDRSWDPMALMEMLTFGFPMAGRTWMHGVRQLQCGRQVRSFADGRTEVRMLLEPVSRRSWSLKQSVTALRENLDEATARICRRLDQPPALALSGGLDSRTILASLHTQKLDHHNFTFSTGQVEARENQIALATAELLGEKHKTVLLDLPLARVLHRDFRLLNEGDSPGFGFFLLAAHVKDYSNALMIGHEAVRETAGSFNPMSVKSKHALAQHMWREYVVEFSPEHAHAILNDPYRVSSGDMRDEWFESFEQIDQPSVMEVFLEHVRDYRVQRRTRHRIDTARWFCSPVYPYMDDRLYMTYLNLPLEHLHGELAPLGLLSDYKLGLEQLPAAAGHFGMPIHQEYRYRQVLRLGRRIKEELVDPLKTRWVETKGVWGFGRSAILSHWELDLDRLKDCHLFNQVVLSKTIEQARGGAFVNGNAISRLIDAVVIDDFLFGSGLSGDRGLQFLESTHDLQLIHSKDDSLAKSAGSL